MTTVLAEGSNSGFRWIDVLAPGPEELKNFADQYGIHAAFVADVLQPEHLPKHETLGNVDFFIIRYHAAEKNKNADTIQKLTNKLAIFHTENLVITMHKYEATFIQDVKKDLIDTNQCRDTFHLLNRLVKAVLYTFEHPLQVLAEEIDTYEAETFLKKKLPPILKGLYHLKRKVEVSKRLLILSKDILEKIDRPEHQNPDTRDTRDLYVRLLTLLDFMSENSNHLFNLYFSLSAQRTNEVIRVLTLFSVFFMPLTFIVGIYGMNFNFMPELYWRWGYPMVLIIMGGITFFIFKWFKSKGWL